MFKAIWLSACLVMLACFIVSPRPAETTVPSDSPPSDQGATGEIAGKALFKGPAPNLAIIHMDQDPVCVAKHAEPVYAEDGKVSENGSLPNIFVYVQAGAENQNFPTPEAPVILDQHGCIYEPHVLGIMVGQELRVVSSDATTHNIHPMPKVNREWNQSQAPGAPPLIKRFMHPEIMIPVKCNQHPWMRAYIGVVAYPFYAVTRSDGVFRIKGVPPGEYTMAAWTATFGSLHQKIRVRAGESAQVNFIFSAK